MAHRTITTNAIGCSNATATTPTTKFKIQQAVLSNSIDKGTYGVERTISPSDVIIRRRLGEGSKPLFDRDDISINRLQPKNYTTSPVKVTQSRRKQSSSSSSSPERYRKRDPTGPSQTSSTTTIFKHIKQKTPERIPYFLDEKREQERLILKYGATSAFNSIKRYQKSIKNSSSTVRRRSYSRSRSRTPPKNFTTHSKSSTSTSFKKYEHSKTQSRSHERHFARSRHRSPHKDERQSRRSLSSEHYTRRHRRSKSRSRSRSHSKDHHKRARSTERKDGGREHEIPKPTTQFITIPVPVDPYGYPAAYPAWSHQPAWPVAAQGAPRYVAPYPLPPVMPSFNRPAIFPPFRPPPPLAPYGMPYTPRIFRPPRFFSRPPRGNFRPRNY